MDNINKDMLNEAILLLGKTYNNPSLKNIEKIITLLRNSVSEKKNTPAVIPATKVKSVRSNFIKTGVEWFDRWTKGGIRPQELVLYGATPHAGKTHLLVWTGAQFLLEGYCVLSIIGEDLLSDIKTYYEAAVKNSNALQNLYFADMQDVRFGVKEVEEAYEYLKSQDLAPEIIIIDHVDLMKSHVSDKADWERISDIMTDLKLLAKKNNLIIITASQLNFTKDAVGMDRFYRAKVGKAAVADLIITVEAVVDQEYEVMLQKARGRRVLAEERRKTLYCDWDKMTIKEVTI